MADSSLEIKMNNLKLSDRTPPPLVSDQSPAETYTSMFEATTPPSGPASPRDTFDQEAEVEELHDYDVTSLKSDDVKADPILADLARKQGRSIHDGAGARPGSTAFKARPAPLSTRQQGVGPRMTKSAALRQGLDWAAMAGPIKKSSTSETDKSLVSGVSQVREGVKPVGACLCFARCGHPMLTSDSQSPRLQPQPSSLGPLGLRLFEQALTELPRLRLPRKTMLHRRLPTRQKKRRSGKGGERASRCLRV